MKAQYISDMAEGVPVDSQFAVRSRDLRAARTGDAYLAMELSDRTGTVPAVMFRPGPKEWSIPPGAVATVRGTVTTYRGVKRVSVSSLRPAADYDRRDMVPTGSRQEGELLDALSSLVCGVKHPGLRAVLDSVFGDPELMVRFRACPASRARHHAYVGGLLEHTVSVASLCKVLSSRYDGVDADLLVCAALLHDVGKVDALAYDTSLDLTEAGRLLGHVVLGHEVLHDAIAAAKERLPSPLALRLQHVVASHHGEREWGAPVRPAMLEAVLLHHADHLDAEAAGFTQAVAGAGVMEERWTDADNQFGRPLVVPAA